MWDYLCSKGGSSVWHGRHRYTLTYSYFEIIRNNSFSSNPRHVWQHGWGCVFASISYMCVCKKWWRRGELYLLIVPSKSVILSSFLIELVNSFLHRPKQHKTGISVHQGLRTSGGTLLCGHYCISEKVPEVVLSESPGTSFRQWWFSEDQLLKI